MAKEAKRVVNDGMNVTLRVSDKGGVSLYGLQRFPITLYKEQWLAILSRKEGILAFIEANKKDLKAKGEAVTTKEGHTPI